MPLLWRRAPTLWAVAPQMVRTAAAGLAPLPPQQLPASLAASAVAASSPAFAVAAALGNLLEAAPKALQVRLSGVRLLLLMQFSMILAS